MDFFQLTISISPPNFSMLSLQNGLKKNPNSQPGSLKKLQWVSVIPAKTKFRLNFCGNFPTLALRDIPLRYLGAFNPCGMKTTQFALFYLTNYLMPGPPVSHKTFWQKTITKEDSQCVCQSIVKTLQCIEL